MRAIVEYHETRDHWLDARRTFIGASESPAIFGHSYAGLGPATVFMSKTSPTYREPTHSMRLGTNCEPGVLKTAEELWGYEIEHATGYPVIRHPHYPFIGCTPDGWMHQDGELVLVEAKNLTRYSQFDRDQEQLPLIYEIQVQHQLLCSGCRRGLWIANDANEECCQRWVEADSAFHQKLIEVLVEFWGCVERGELPHDADAAAEREALAQYYRQDTGRAIELEDDEYDQLLAQRDELSAQLKALEEQRVAIDNRIKRALGDASYGVLPSGRVASWKVVERAGYTVAPTSSRQFRILNKLPKGVVIDDHDNDQRQDVVSDDQQRPDPPHAARVA